MIIKSAALMYVYSNVYSFPDHYNLIKNVIHEKPLLLSGIHTLSLTQF